jgi:hypothetical protein
MFLIFILIFPNYAQSATDNQVIEGLIVPLAMCE